MTGTARTFLLLVGGCLLFGPGCTISREVGPGRPIDSYDYCVVGEEGAHRYATEATRILDQSFVVLSEHDPRLRSQEIKGKTCVLALEWSRGFWSSSATASVRDYRDEHMVHESSLRRGMFWAGYHGDVLDVLHDVAAVRAHGPAVPAEARRPAVEVATDPPPERSKAGRLTELNDLKARGLITDAEYSAQRAKILDER